MNDTIEIHEEKDSGFTLIELLIVIVILGILATVTVFAVGGITDQGQKSACAAERKTIEVAIEAYRAQNSNDPPADLTALAAYFNSPPANYTVAAGVIGAPAASKCNADGTAK